MLIQRLAEYARVWPRKEGRADRSETKESMIGPYLKQPGPRKLRADEFELPGFRK